MNAERRDFRAGERLPKVKADNRSGELRPGERILKPGEPIPASGCSPRNLADGRRVMVVRDVSSKPSAPRNETLRRLVRYVGGAN